MDTTSDTHDRIELRSEKVRKLIGEIPPSLVRGGQRKINPPAFH